MPPALAEALLGWTERPDELSATGATTARESVAKKFEQAAPRREPWRISISKRSGADRKASAKRQAS